MKFSDMKEAVSFEKEKIVISVGDAGAIFSYFENGKLSIRLFAATPSPEDTASFLDMLRNNPEVPVIMVIDVMDQSYTQQTLPAVGKLSINKLVKQRLKREFAETDLTGFINLGRNSDGRKDWNFIFISIPAIYPISQWIEFLNSVPNKFEGIYLLPVESVGAIREVCNKIASDDGRKPSEWKMLVTHNKVGGFRQVVTKKNQIVFTRMIGGGQDTIPDILAGSIEQEILNTMEYIKRLSYNESSSLDIVITVSEDIKACLDPNKLRAKYVTIFTPYELSRRIGFNDSSHRNDKFVDTLMASYFVKHKRRMQLTTPEMRKINNIYLTKSIIKRAVMVMIPLFIAYVGFMGYKTWQLIDDIAVNATNLKSIQAVYEKEISSFNEQNQGLSLEMATKVNNTAKLYLLLSGRENNPLSLISQFGKIKNSEILVKEFTWEFVDAAPKDNKRTPARSRARNVSQKSDASSSQIKVMIKASIKSRGLSFQELFDIFDDFISKVEKQFSNYNIDYSRLPSKISLGKDLDDIPITISIMGPIRAGK